MMWTEWVHVGRDRVRWKKTQERKMDPIFKSTVKFEFYLKYVNGLDFVPFFTAYLSLSWIFLSFNISRTVIVKLKFASESSSEGVMVHTNCWIYFFSLTYRLEHIDHRLNILSNVCWYYSKSFFSNQIASDTDYAGLGTTFLEHLMKIVLYGNLRFFR